METTLKNLENPLKRPLKNPEKSLRIFSGHPVSNNRELSLLYPNNTIWNIEKFGQEFRDSHTTIWITNHEKIKMLIKLRFSKINPREKSRGSQFAKLNLREMLKKWPAKVNPHDNFSPSGTCPIMTG